MQNLSIHCNGSFKASMYLVLCVHNNVRDLFKESAYTCKKKQTQIYSYTIWFFRCLHSFVRLKEKWMNMNALIYCGIKLEFVNIIC